MPGTTTSGLIQLSLVCIPTPDQDRALEFYVGTLGFEKRTDEPFGGGYRWIEVYPPSGTAGIALAPPPQGAAIEPYNTGIAITTDDIDATHAALQDAGADVDPEVSRMGGNVPPLFWMRDPDGYTLMVVENPQDS